MNHDSESVTRRFNALRDTYRNDRFWPEEKGEGMTRSEAYAEGFHQGRRNAEADIRDHSRGVREPEVDHYRRGLWWPENIGQRRGYRDTWARWDAGTLTASMLEHAPLRAGR